MPRRAVLAFAVTIAVGFGVVLWRSQSTQLPLAFPVGPGPAGVAGLLPPRAEVCQTPIEVLADAAAVSFTMRTGARPGAPLQVTVRDLHGSPLGRARIRGGYPDRSVLMARFPAVREGTAISLCIRNDGAYPTYPTGGDAVPGTGTVVAGRPSGVDLSLTFLRPHPRSALSLVPTMFRRAALFRYGWVGAWTFWVLAALVIVAVPALCAFALSRAARETP